jgi:ribosomal protein S7
MNDEDPQNKIISNNETVSQILKQLINLILSIERRQFISRFKKSQAKKIIQSKVRSRSLWQAGFSIKL